MHLEADLPIRTNEAHLHAQMADMEAEGCGMELETERLPADRDMVATEGVRLARMELEATLRSCRTTRARIDRTRDYPIGKQERVPQETSAFIQPIGGDAEPRSLSSHRRMQGSISYLSSQYEELCREERAIEDKVERELEKRERVARERLGSAEMELEEAKRMAEGAIVAMEEANGWVSGFRPWAQPGDRDGHADKLVLEGLGVGLTPVPVNAVHLEQPSETLSMPPCATDPNVAPTAMQMPSPHQFSIPPFPMSFISPVINPASFVYLPIIASSNTQPPTHPSFTKLQVSIFEKYEWMVSVALNAGPNLIIPQVPWPILTRALSTYPTTDLTRKVFKPDAISHFFCMYICWKGWDEKVGRDALLEDWIFLLNQIPRSKPGGHRAAAKTVAALRTLV